MSWAFAALLLILFLAGWRCCVRERLHAAYERFNRRSAERELDRIKQSAVMTQTHRSEIDLNP